MAIPDTIEWPFPWQGLMTAFDRRHVPANGLRECVNLYYTSPEQLRTRGDFSHVKSAASGDISTMLYWPHDDTIYGWDDVTDAIAFNDDPDTDPVMVLAKSGGLYTSDGSTQSSISKPTDTIQGAQFQGTGTDDLSTSGSYSGDESRQYVVQITKEDSPDQFRWSDDGGDTWNSEVDITGTAQTLSNGVEVTFGSTDGHTNRDLWYFYAYTYPDVPNGTGLLNRWGRLWTYDDDYVYWSAPLDYTKWGGLTREGGYLGIAPGHFGSIVAWMEIETSLFIWKEHALFELSGDNVQNMVLRKTAELDKALPNTVADCRKGIAYATSQGVFPLGKPPAGDVSWTERVDNAITLGSDSHAAYAPEVSAYIIVNGSSTAWMSNQHNRPDVWTKWELPWNATDVYMGGGTLYFGTSSGDIYKYDDLGACSEKAYFTTGDWDGGDVARRKGIQFIEGAFNAQANAIANVNVYTDGNNTPAKREAIHANDHPVFPFRASVRTIGIKVEYSNITGPERCTGWSLRGELEKEGWIA